MNWESAVVVLRNEGKITRPNWEAEHFWQLSKDGYERILCHDGTNASVHIQQTEADDWELWEEKSSLSDKLKDFTLIEENEVIAGKDVKQFIKDLKKEFGKDEFHEYHFPTCHLVIIDKLAGEKLC